MPKKSNRRVFVKKSLTVSAGLALARSFEERALLASLAEKDAGKENRPEQYSPGLSVPAGKIGNIRISRLICGGNLIIGSAHDRDLIYVSDLLRHYFTDDKIVETWQLCEDVGINTMIGPVNSPYARGEDPTLRVYNRYRDEFGGKIQWIAQTYPKTTDLTGSIRTAIDNGAVGAFPHGEIGDRWVQHGRADLLAKVIEFIKSNGLIAGIACHNIKVPMALEKAGVKADFYMKTLHHGNYWSATLKEQWPEWGNSHHDNMWCLRPNDTIEFMETVKKPWISFKVLAAGAIHPRDGFRFAFENGADFANVGMFDFQVRENAIIVRTVIDQIKQKGRSRPWMG